MQVDASVDHRLFTEEGHKQIEKDYEDTKGAATALIRPIDKRIEGFDNREADRAKEKIRSELAKKYSSDVVDYFISKGEENGWFDNIGKINEGFYKADDSSIDNLVNLSLDGIISNPKSPNQTTPNTSSREAEVVVTAPKPATLGVAVVDTLGDVAHFVKGVPDNQKAAANDFYTLLTGGPIGFVTSKAVEKGMTLLPDPVLQTIASTSEKVTNIAGQAGTSVLVGVDFDKVKESQESGHEVTEDRVSGVGAVVVTVAGAATAGAAGVLIAKAKTPKIKNKKNSDGNPGVEDAEAGGVSQYDKFKKQPDPKVDSDWNWPENKGFAGVPVKNILSVGTKIDRFGKPTGSFTSPEGISFEQRALAPGSKAENYYVYEVQKPLPVLQGEIAPAFGEVGGGIQILPDFPQRVNIQWLLDNGYLKRVN